MPDTEILIYINKFYPFIKKIKNIKKIEHNDINSINYLIQSETEKFVLRSYTDNQNANKIEKMCKILQFCINKKSKVYEPIKNKNNKYTDHKKKKFLTKYYSGHTFSGNLLETNDIAKNLALLHKSLANSSEKYYFRPNNSFYVLITSSEISQIRELLNKKQDLSKFDKNLLKKLDFLLIQIMENNNLRKTELSSSIKKQLIHFDLHPQNVIFYKNKVSAILDFSSMRKGMIIEDIAFASYRFAIEYEKEIDSMKKRIKLFVDKYRIYNQIDEYQLENIDFYFKLQILRRLSYILKKYLQGVESWTQDLEKNFKFLCLAKRIGNPLKEKI